MSFSIIVYIIVCVVAIIFFLLHESEKGGMGIIGGYSNTLLGTSRVSILGKIATIFAVLFFMSALFLSIMSSGNKSILQNLSKEITPAQTTNQVQETTDQSDNATSGSDATNEE